ncbi:MAG: PKD domain-containing protein [Gammaproteobacteria bacterium]|nr:PKD domain-containing protein [Gammaproteobacteria bacterium]
MTQAIRSGLLVLLIFGVPICGQAQSHARFSVEPSDPELQAGVGAPGTEFTFTADVADAESYRIEIVNDRPPVDAVIDPGADAVGTYTHTFDRAGRYPVKLTATQTSGELIELELNVRVEAPPSAPRPPAEHARFTVLQSDSDDWADFTFIADVSNAESYDVDFGDNVIARNIAPDGNGRATLRHRYSSPGDYSAVMNALRNDGATIEQTIQVSATQPAAPAQRALFSVTPSDPEAAANAERPWANFTFTADVTGATQYEFLFGDNQQQVVTAAADGRGSVRHQYTNDGTFDATLMALLDSGDIVTESLQVTVRAPAVTPPAAPKPNWWPWILFALATISLIYSLYRLLIIKTGNHLISFEPRMDAVSVRVSGSTAANESVSMRLRRDPGRIALAVNDGE